MIAHRCPFAPGNATQSALRGSPARCDAQQRAVEPRLANAHAASVKTHQDIDRRSLALARAVVQKLESGDLSAGLDHVRKRSGPPEGGPLESNRLDPDQNNIRHAV